MTPERWAVAVGAFIGAVAGVWIGLVWLRPYIEIIAEASVWLAELRKADSHELSRSGRKKQ